MKIVVRDFDLIADEIKVNNRKIVMFGAGVIGQIASPEILKRYNLHNNIVCYIDNDSSKWGTYIHLYNKKIEIKSPEYLYNCSDTTAIFINISRYTEVKEQLEKMECTKNMVAYIMPMLCIYNMCSDLSIGKPILTKDPIIPKKINYMWFGKKNIPDNLKKCIETWYKFCPDYEIIEWNEDNYDIEKHPYMKQAYEAGAYGFIPDYARIDILYNEGGIYMDTDIELRKNLDDMLYQEAFCGVEKWQVINFGGCSGSVKGNMMIKKFMDARDEIRFINEDGTHNRNTCGFYDTSTAIKLGYKLDGTTQSVNGMNIYAYDYFHPYDYMSGLCNITEHTYSIHHFNGGWMDKDMKTQNRLTSQMFLELYEESID